MKNLKLFNLTLLAISIFSFSGVANAEYKMGKDYTRIDNPLPVKQDGVVEVMEVFWYAVVLATLSMVRLMAGKKHFLMMLIFQSYL